MRGSIALVFLCSLCSQFDSFAGHTLLGKIDTLGDPLDDMPVAIARRKVHLGICVCGISAQDHLHSARRLDEVPPVGRS